MFFNVLIPFQSLKWIMKFQPSGFRMISRVREVLLAAIFKTQITATRGLESLMSRQIRIPHTQIRLEQPLIHNCTILQCPKCYILHYSGFYCMSKLCLHVVSLFIPLPSILTSWILCYDSDDCTRSLRSLGEGGIIL